MAFLSNGGSLDYLLVYIEKVDVFNDTVLFDFYDSNEFSIFGEDSDYPIIIGRPSMVIIENYFLRKVQENTIYLISRKVVNELKQKKLISIVENSFLIGFKISLDSSIVNLFEKSITLSVEEVFNRGQFVTVMGDSNNLPRYYTGSCRVKVRDVGQANWNEFYVNDQCKFLFDIGAPYRSDHTKVREIISDREEIIIRDSPGLFISHWDTDHYHSLLSLSDQTLQSFSFFVCRNDWHNLTIRVLASRIVSLIGKQRVFSIPAETRTSRSPHFLLRSDASDQLLIFNAEKHKDRNKSGIAVSYRDKKSSIIFTGDCHYYQLSQSILPHLAYEGHHNLVVPHHGGNAGKFIYNIGKCKFSVAAISVGKNGYGHPAQPTKQSLGRRGFKIKQTNINNDIEINLQ